MGWVLLLLGSAQKTGFLAFPKHLLSTQCAERLLLPHAQRFHPLSETEAD